MPYSQHSEVPFHNVLCMNMTKVVFLVCSVPHFEKMLYDQAQLVNVYLDAFAVTKDVTYSYVARDTLDYLIRDMMDPDGGIYSAEDADSAESLNSHQKKEGLFYVWTLQEVSWHFPSRT